MINGRGKDGISLRDAEFAIVSMASEIGTNVVTLHLEFCHWNKL